MLNFMDQVQAAWLHATSWNEDNSYSNLTSTSSALLDFPTPRGLRFSVSSLSSPHLATSYTLGSVGVVDGSVSYLYSSVPFRPPTTILQSGSIPLRHVLEGYRTLRPLRRPDELWWWEVWHRGKRIDRRDTLLYGRLYLPSSSLEALYMRRISPRQQFQLSCVSDSRLKNGGTILLSHQIDTGKSSLESLYSTDSALLGLRGLYNFGALPTHSYTQASTSSTPPTSPASTRLSLGAEMYYGLLDNSFGLSTGLRFVNTPVSTSLQPPGSSSTALDTNRIHQHQQLHHTNGGTSNSSSPASFPFTATLTLNPLMGTISATYAVKNNNDIDININNNTGEEMNIDGIKESPGVEENIRSPPMALASRLDFNVYSWESNVVLGCELWRMKSSSSSSSSSSPSSSKKQLPAELLNNPLEQEEESTSLPPPLLSSNTPEPEPDPESTNKPQPNRTSHETSSSSKDKQKDKDKDTDAEKDKYQGILKARININQSGTIGLLYEGRYKGLLFSVGSSLNFLPSLSSPPPRSPPRGSSAVVEGSSQPATIQSFGVEIQYSS